MRAGSRGSTLDTLWAHHHGELRDPHQVVVQWPDATRLDPRLLQHRVRGRFWDAVERSGATLLVTREYEHLVMAMTVAGGRPRLSHLRLPHPNGIAVDADRQRVLIASTRNPNVVFEFRPMATAVPRDLGGAVDGRGVLLPWAARYLPGCLYVHELALISGRLHANAVALNAVVRLPAEGGFEPAWWPRAIDSRRGPRFGRNYLQLNSIAAGRTLRDSFFSATTATPSTRRPGHLNFAVDGRGVIFSGRTRDVAVTGLTRPHSARLFDGELWVDNSGYGEVGRAVSGRYEPVMKLPGWTRGLCRADDILFVGTSRVIPRYRHYAPGVDPSTSETGVHAIDLRSGRLIGSLVWPFGNQIFAVESMQGIATSGFPFAAAERRRGRWRQQVLFSGRP